MQAMAGTCPREVHRRIECVDAKVSSIVLGDQHFPVKKGKVLFRGLGEIYRLFFAKIAATALTTANSIELRANFITR
jgi:hypothetical protein